MFISDPNFSIPDPRLKRFRIPDPDRQLKIEVLLTPKIVSKLSEIRSGMFIPDPDLDFLSILDPRSGTATLSKNDNFLKMLV
jgi:hypothetical protein